MPSYFYWPLRHLTPFRDFVEFCHKAVYPIMVAEISQIYIVQIAGKCICEWTNWNYSCPKANLPPSLYVFNIPRAREKLLIPIGTQNFPENQCFLPPNIIRTYTCLYVCISVNKVNKVTWTAVSLNNLF